MGNVFTSFPCRRGSSHETFLFLPIFCLKFRLSYTQYFRCVKGSFDYVGTRHSSKPDHCPGRVTCSARQRGAYSTASNQSGWFLHNLSAIFPLSDSPELYRYDHASRPTGIIHRHFHNHVQLFNCVLSNCLRFCLSSLIPFEHCYIG